MSQETKQGSLLQRLISIFITTDMTRGNPYRILTLFTVPMLIGNIFQQFYNIVDSIVVGNYVSSQALAAVGTGFPFLMMLTSFFIGIGIGAMVIISQCAGAKNYEELQLTVETIYRTMLVVVIPFSVLGIALSRPILVLMNVPNDGTLDQATVYLMIVFVGMVGSMGFNMNAGLLQGMGDAATSLIFLAVATVINVILDFLFVLGFHMGVSGVALATVIAQFSSWILGTLYINRRYPFIHIRLNRLRYNSSILKRAVQLGIPSGIQQMLFSVGNVVVQALVNRQGSAFMAGFTAATKVDAFVFLPIQSFSTAISTFVGQNYGARLYQRIRQGTRAGLWLSAGVAAVTALLVYPFSDALVALFTPAPDDILAGRIYLHSVLPFYPLLAVLFTFGSSLRGIGRMFVATLSTFVSMWLLRVPMAQIFLMTLGREYMYYSYGIGWIAGALISGIYFYYGDRRGIFYKNPPLESKPLV